MIAFSLISSATKVSEKASQQHRSTRIPFQLNHKKEKFTMRTRICIILVALVAIFGASQTSNVSGLRLDTASANQYQAHQGACGTSTTSIKKGISNLKHLGVLSQVAAHYGIKGGNGSIAYQMQHKLVIGSVAKKVVVKDTGCDGHGHVFPWVNVTLGKGDKVVAKRPSAYSESDVCTKSHKGCKAFTFSSSYVEMVSCWNGTYKIKVTIRVTIWVKVKKSGGKHKSSHGTPSQPTKPSCKTDQVMSANGVCNGTATGTTTGGVCDSTNIGNANSGNGQVGSCNTQIPVCSGNATNNSTVINCPTTIVTPPPTPTCEQNGTCPPNTPQYNAQCTGFNVTDDTTVAYGVIGQVQYTASTGVSFDHMVVDWGDGKPAVTYNSASGKYKYGSGSNYAISATVYFKTPSGDVFSAGCGAVHHSPKDGTQGAGSGTVSGPTGGSSPGGSPAPGNDTATPCYLPGGDLGYVDSKGDCVAAS